VSTFDQTDNTKALRADLARLARFGANIADAHSCFIFLPRRLVLSAAESATSANDEAAHLGRGEEDLLMLGGLHSLSTDVFRECVLPRGSGLIGWVAKHNRSIHVSPFERDSRTLGVYSIDQQLKSFIGIPIPVASGGAVVGDETGEPNPSVGVVACDSKKAFAFSKVQGKLLEDLAREISRHVELTAVCTARSSFETSWDTFSARGERLLEALGPAAVDVVRLRPCNGVALERALGSGEMIALVERTYRLIEQALPPHSPIVRLPNGEMLFVVDNMMSSFYEGKIRAICGHVGANQRAKVTPEFEFVRSGSGGRRKRSEVLTLRQLVAETIQEQSQGAHGALDHVVGGEGYGYRRA
jgi:hypothetical protein